MPNGETGGDVAMQQRAESSKPPLEIRLKAIAADRQPNAKRDLVARLSDNKNRTGFLAEDTVASIIGDRPDLSEITDNTCARLASFGIDFTRQDARMRDLMQEVLTEEGLVVPKPRDFTMRPVEELESRIATGAIRTSEAQPVASQQEAVPTPVVSAPTNTSEAPAPQPTVSEAPASPVAPVPETPPVIAGETPPPEETTLTLNNPNTQPPTTEQAVGIPATESLSIGRNNENGLILSDPQISRRHAQITARDGAYWLEDLQSRNGTQVNGAEATNVQLQDGDTITMGQTKLQFNIGEDGKARLTALRAEAATEPATQPVPEPTPAESPAPETPTPTPTVAEQVAQAVDTISHDEAMSIVHGTYGQEAPAPQASPNAGPTEEPSPLPTEQLPETTPPLIPAIEKPAATLPTSPTEPITRGTTPEDQYREIQKEKQQASDPFAGILEGPRNLVQEGLLTSASAAYKIAFNANAENPEARQAILREMEELYLNNKTNSTIRVDFAKALIEIGQVAKATAVSSGTYSPEPAKQQEVAT